MKNGHDDFHAQAYELRLLMSASSSQRMLIIHKFPEHHDRLATSEWHEPYSCPAFPLEWHPPLSGAFWVHPKTVAGRTVLSNELVLESDSDDYEFMAHATQKVLCWLRDNGACPWLSWSGNKSYHVHVLFTAPIDVPEEMAAEFESNPEFDVAECVRDYLRILVENDTGLQNAFDPALTHWSSSSRGRMIRMPGSIHPKSGGFCTIVDSVSNTKPIDLPVRNLTQKPPRWDISMFSEGLFKYLGARLEEEQCNSETVKIDPAALTGSVACLPPKLRMVVNYLIAVKPLPPHSDAAHRLRVYVTYRCKCAGDTSGRAIV
ncbi:MAG: hypothetical protein KIS29_05270 [Thermoplasmata archaeon]|nr:hypothetical protein [Candidatus Sysuiplasma jiujiangense]